MSNYLITGSSRGLGLALTTHLASLPVSKVSTVFATARTLTPALESLITSHSSASGPRVIFITLDTTSSSSIAAAVAQVTSTLNYGQNHGLDILINNAAILPRTPDGVETMTAPELDNVLHTNVTSAHLVTAAFLPLLRAGDRKMIVNVSSTMGSMALARDFAYAPAPAYKVSKAALNMLTVLYAMDLEEEGFTVVCISPGVSFSLFFLSFHLLVFSLVLPLPSPSPRVPTSRLDFAG